MRCQRLPPAYGICVRPGRRPCRDLRLLGAERIDHGEMQGTAHGLDDTWSVSDGSIRLFYPLVLSATPQKDLGQRAGQAAEGAGEDAELPYTAKDQVGEDGHADQAADEGMDAAPLPDV